MPDLLNDANSPAYRNAAWTRQQPALTLVRDLAGGTPVIRAKGETYLPKEAGESQTAYDVRLARSLLFNTFVKVREALIGMALKRNPELQDDVPAQIKSDIEDIDLEGNHLDVFIKESFRDVINDGHVIWLIDMQPPLDRSLTSLSSTPTAEDDQIAGRRPYWVKYRKDQAINWKSDRINGEKVLTKLTLEECATKTDGEYGEQEVKRYRVLTLPKLAEKTATRPAVYGPMVWELFEKRTTSGQDSYDLIDGNVTDLDRIPIVVIYARKKGLLESDPPLLDLAYLNIGHWQQWSDLNCQLRMLVPILHIKGEILNVPEAREGSPKPQLKIGPGVAVQTDKDGAVAYVSADAEATQGMSDNLSSLEQRMSAVGLSIIAPKPTQPAQAPTATEKVMDQNERESELASWLRALKDGIEAAFQVHAEYLGLPDGGSIILGFDEVDPEAVQAVEAPKGGVQPQQVPAPTMVQ